MSAPWPVIVLGMHRSGTSCLAGCLESAGLYLGAVNTQAPFNARGNRENRAIMDLNDAVLAASGGAWDDPPGRVDWCEEHKQRRDEIVAAYPKDTAWGFKEPRTLLTLAGWLEALPNARLVGTFRHPAAVAQSLKHRNAFTEDKSHALWLAYNRRLLALWQIKRFPLVCFDWEPEVYLARVGQVAQGLGLARPEQAAGFFGSELRHHRPQTILPPELQAVYDALRVAAENQGVDAETGR